MRAVNGDPGASYEWVVNGHVQGYGNPIDVMFTTLGQNNVTVTATGGLARSRSRRRRRSERVQSVKARAHSLTHSQIVRDAEQWQGMMLCVQVEVMVRYVRREIRSLTDQDREAFFQAVMLMQVRMRQRGSPF